MFQFAAQGSKTGFRLSHIARCQIQNACVQFQKLLFGAKFLLRFLQRRAGKFKIATTELSHGGLMGLLPVLASAAKANDAQPHDAHPCQCGRTPEPRKHLHGMAVSIGHLVSSAMNETSSSRIRNRSLNRCSVSAFQRLPCDNPFAASRSLFVSHPCGYRATPR